MATIAIVDRTMGDRAEKRAFGRACRESMRKF